MIIKALKFMCFNALIYVNKIQEEEEVVNVFVKVELTIEEEKEEEDQTSTHHSRLK